MLPGVVHAGSSQHVGVCLLWVIILKPWLTLRQSRSPSLCRDLLGISKWSPGVHLQRTNLVWMVSRSVGLLLFWLISTWMQKVGWEGWTLVGVFLINIITERERIGEPHVFLLVILTWYYVFREQLPVLHSLATWLGTPFLYWLGPPVALRTSLTL